MWASMEPAAVHPELTPQCLAHVFRCGVKANELLAWKCLAVYRHLICQAPLAVSNQRNAAISYHSQLPTRDAVRVTCVQKLWRDIVQTDELLWKSFMMADLGLSITRGADGTERHTFR